VVDQGIEQKSGRTRARSDGTNEKDYANCKKWSPKRWAWEFLRRNQSFAVESKEALGQGENERRAVAEKYGLKRFKPAREGYRGGHGLPLFISGSIQSWINSEDVLLKFSTKKVRQNQMVILFDLEMMMTDRASLRNQLLEASRRIKNRLSELEIKLNKKAAVHAPKWHPMTFSLRLLDLLDVAKKKPLDCFLILDKVLSEDFKKEPVDTRNRINSMASNRIKSARQIATEDYRYIANMKPREIY
jgi:hypothetical protein